MVSPNSIDPGLENDITDEFVTGIDRELMPDLAVGVSYIWRRYHNFQARIATPRRSRYSPVTFQRSTAPCGNTLCDAAELHGDVLSTPVALPTGTVLRLTRARASYNGIELTARKRFAKNG